MRTTHTLLAALGIVAVIGSFQFLALGAVPSVPTAAAPVRSREAVQVAGLEETGSSQTSQDGPRILAESGTEPSSVLSADQARQPIRSEQASQSFQSNRIALVDLLKQSPARIRILAPKNDFLNPRWRKLDDAETRKWFSLIDETHPIYSRRVAARKSIQEKELSELVKEGAIAPLAPERDSAKEAAFARRLEKAGFDLAKHADSLEGWKDMRPDILVSASGKDVFHHAHDRWYGAAFADLPLTTAALAFEAGAFAEFGVAVVAFYLDLGCLSDHESVALIKELESYEPKRP